MRPLQFFLLILLLLPLLLLTCSAVAEDSAGSEAIDDQRLASHVAVLEHHGKEPIPFVLDRLDEVDLILFDDAWHPVVEPFELYRDLVNRQEFRAKVDVIFVEAFPVSHQPVLDRFFSAPEEDLQLLAPLLQDDFSGHGWALKTYIDLLQTIYRVNRGVPEEERLEVVAVNDPVYWSALHDRQDLDIFRQSLVGNDYGMYRKILSTLDGFTSGKKGIFLTNTRHAYKGIRRAGGDYFWNCGTFFAQWHPGKTSSIRFHHLMLTIRRETASSTEPTTTAGLERYEYSFERVAGGLWDEAFAAYGNRPVAFDLAATPFGETPYAGNHMHKAAAQQTLHDANDSIIFLVPVEKLHTSAKIDFIYTPEFQKELARRYRILYSPEQLKTMIEDAGVDGLQELIEVRTRAQRAALIPQTQNLPPAQAWRY